MNANTKTKQKKIKFVVDNQMKYGIILRAHLCDASYKWPVGETVNTHAFHACICGFEPRTGHHF